MTDAEPDLPPLIDAVDVHRVYGRAGSPTAVHALRGVTMTVRRGEYLAIAGPSGSGKSTLLNLFGALDRPTSGSLALAGRELDTLSDVDLAEFRNRRVGFVFQSFHLLPRLTAAGNVAVPLVYRGTGRRERRQRAADALAAVGLADRAHHRPGELSGGQQQRVAIARALVGEPDLVLADEPTGNLDTRTGDEVMDLLDGLQASRGTALVVISHDEHVAARARRRLAIVDGRLLDAEDA